MSSNNKRHDDLSPCTGTGTTTTTTTTTSTIRSRPRRMVSFPDSDPDHVDVSSPPYSRGTTPPYPYPPSRTGSGTGSASPSPFPSRGVSPLPMRHPSRATATATATEPNGVRIESKSTTDLLDVSWSSLQSLASSVLGSDTRPGSRSGAGSANGSARHGRKPSRPDFLARGSGSKGGTSTPKWGPSGPAEIGAGTREERHALVQAKKREVLLLADSEGGGRRGPVHKRRDSTERDRDGDRGEGRDEGALAYVHSVLPTDTITGVTIKYGCQAAVFRKANGFWPSDSIQSRGSVLLPVESCSVKGRPIDLLEGEHVPPSTSTAEGGHGDGDKIWKHESWVQIDGFQSPVEIGRVPRRALGFFPRTRRKSVSYDDGQSGTDGPPPPRRGPGHQRRRSQLHLSGTGVGTLDRKSTAPGPALDGLSRFFAQHLPTISQSPESSGLDNLGGAVEGWVRRVTSKAKTSLADLNQSPASESRPRPGDLIELDDSPDLPSSRSTSIQPGGITSRTRSRVKDD